MIRKGLFRQKEAAPVSITSRAAFANSCPRLTKSLWSIARRYCPQYKGATLLLSIFGVNTLLRSKYFLLINH